MAVVKLYVRYADEILDSCEASGKEIGGKNARVGCSAVNSKCSRKTAPRVGRLSQAAAFEGKLDVGGEMSIGK